ncbi:MAG: bifunctional phosphoglucose/phosphomannose isomerase [bacterium]|nr:bifunctional phosphoglucose/phosphomannose isomerase [bacterium]
MNWIKEDFGDLDNPTTYSHDPSGIYSWIENSSKKLDEAINQFWGKVDIRNQLGEEFHEVLVCGMGGSGIAGDLAYSIISRDIPVPFRVVKGYELPKSVGVGSLVLILSYSGNTEEVVWCYTKAHNRGAHCVAISVGGAIKDMAEKFGCPHIPLPDYYPAPRLALWHLLTAVLACLNEAFPQLGFVEEALRDSVPTLKRGTNRYSKELELQKNFAKKLAFDIHQAWPVIIGSELTWPVAKRFQAQLNENSKWPATASYIPEMNHNEIVAYSQPGPATSSTGIIMLRDKEDHSRIQHRQDFTIELVQKHVAWVHQFKGEGKSFLSRIASLIQTADYASYYLACARGIDPAGIKSIDILKERLGKLQ